MLAQAPLLQGAAGLQDCGGRRIAGCRAAYAAARRRNGTEGAAVLGDREKRMAAALESKYGEKVARAFRGGIEVLYSASEDKVAQSAHSLREVLDMIVKADKGGDKRDDRLPEEEGDSKKDTRFARDLDAVMIPGRRKLPDDTLYKKIVKNRVELLRIAHHGTPPPADKYRRTVDEFEELLEDYR